MDETPYGFHHAEQYGFDVVFAKDTIRRGGGRLEAWLNRLFGFDLMHAWTNRKLIVECDVVWTMTEGEGFAIAFLFAIGMLPPKPVICNVVWLMNTWHFALQYKKLIYRLLAKRISILSVHSQACLEIARLQLPRCRSELMYFGINSDLLVPMKRAATAPGTRLRILSMGSDKTRDWPTLLAAFGNDPRCHLTIVCWRLNSTDIELYDNVVLGQVKTNSAFLQHLRDADMVVVPMVENVFSGITAALDAVAVGVPVVSTRTGGVPTYFDEDQVAFVPPSDPDALREAVYAGNDTDRKARAVRALARFHERDYSTRRLARRYCDLSRELLGSIP